MCNPAVQPSVEKLSVEKVAICYNDKNDKNDLLQRQACNLYNGKMIQGLYKHITAANILRGAQRSMSSPIHTYRTLSWVKRAGLSKLSGKLEWCNLEERILQKEQRTNLHAELGIACSSFAAGKISSNKSL